MQVVLSNVSGLVNHILNFLAADLYFNLKIIPLYDSIGWLRLEKSQNIHLLRERLVSLVPSTAPTLDTSLHFDVVRLLGEHVVCLLSAAAQNKDMFSNYEVVPFLRQCLVSLAQPKAPDSRHIVILWSRSSLAEMTIINRAASTPDASQDVDLWSCTAP